MNIIRVVRKVRLTKGRIGRILVNKRCTGCYIYKPDRILVLEKVLVLRKVSTGSRES